MRVSFSMCLYFPWHSVVYQRLKNICFRNGLVYANTQAQCCEQVFDWSHQFDSGFHLCVLILLAYWFRSYNNNTIIDSAALFWWLTKQTQVKHRETETRLKCTNGKKETQKQQQQQTQWTTTTISIGCEQHCDYLHRLSSYLWSIFMKQSEASTQNRDSIAATHKKSGHMSLTSSTHKI